MSRSQMNQTAQIILNNIVAEQRRQAILAGGVYECTPWQGLYGECKKCQSCLDAAHERAAGRRKIWSSKGPLCHYTAKDAFEVDWSYEWECINAFRDPQGRIVFEFQHNLRKYANRYMRFFSTDVEDYEIYSVIQTTAYGSSVHFLRLDYDSRKKFSLHQNERYLKSQADIDNYIYPGIEVAS
jgi:hypothetical protein